MEFELEENTRKEEKKTEFSDYLYVLYKWRKFIIINLLIVSIITTVIAFLIPKEYKATATIMIPPDNQMSGLGGLTSLLGGKSKSSMSSLGARMFGSANTSEDVLLGILNSRSSITNIINKYNLMEYYDIDDNNMDKVVKLFRNDISADPNEFGMIEFSIINKDPKLSAEIANYLVYLVDSINIMLNIQNAKNNRIYLEKRYIQNVSDLKTAEDSLYNFQKKYGIVAVPEQLEISVKAAAEIESQLIKKEMESYFISQQFGENTPQYQGIQTEIRLLKNKIMELKNSSNLNATSNILFPFNKMPDISIQYLRTFRDVEIQQAILEIVMPMYEQAKVEEQKSIPTIMIVDKATTPQLKYSPKRLVIISGFLLIALFFMIPIVFWGETLLNKTKFNNIIEQKLNLFFYKLKNLYRF